MQKAVFLLSVVVATCLVGLAIFAPWLVPQNPYDLASLDLLDGRLPPGSESFSGMTYVLGTDDLGRDIFSAIAYGLRISITVGIVASTIAMLIGSVLGILAAYHGGLLDRIIMRLVDLQLALPTILVAIAMIAAFGKGMDKVIISIIIVQWSFFARTARAAALSEVTKDYIMASRNLNMGAMRTIFIELAPNIAGPILILLSIEMAAAIALEATLSFLGVGLPVTEPSLGLLIANGYQFLLSGEYWISVLPGVALFLLIVSLNFVGESLGGRRV